MSRSYLTDDGTEEPDCDLYSLAEPVTNQSVTDSVCVDCSASSQCADSAKENRLCTAKENHLCARSASEFFKIDSPMSGELVSLQQVPDELFSSGAMGQGVAIVPQNGTIVAPCDGAVVYNMNFCHMIGLVSVCGVEILIHVGLDSVRPKDNPFQCHVRESQMVKKGDLLLTANLEAMRKSGGDLYTLVTVINAGHYKSVTLPSAGKVTAGEPLMMVS